MKKALAVAGATSAGQGCLQTIIAADSTRDAAMLRFAAAAILESDFRIQYIELGGIQDSEVPSGHGIPTYSTALQNLDSDFPQYIHDNTDDEITHFTFLNAYLMSKGAAPANLDQFRTLTGSMATGSSGKPRLTNLMQLTLDTSTISQQREQSRSRSEFHLSPTGLASGQFTAIPRTEADLSPPQHLQTAF